MKNIEGGAAGVFGVIEYLDGETKIKKTYLEFTQHHHKPSLHTVADYLITLTAISEHEAHALLLKYKPDEYPNIYEYNETKWIDVPSEQRMKLKNNKDTNYINQCTVVMDVVQGYNLDDDAYKVFNKSNPAQTSHIIALYFTELINIIKTMKLLPCDRHFGNVFYDPKHDKLKFIDYGFFRTINVIHHITNDDIGHTFHHEPNNTMYRDNEELAPTSDDIPDTLAQLILCQHLCTFDMCREYLHEVIPTVFRIHGTETPNIFIAALKEAKVCTQFTNEIMKIVVNAKLTTSINKAVANWLGGPYPPQVPSRRVLLYLKTNPAGFKAVYYKTLTTLRDIKRKSTSELWESLKQCEPVERCLILMLYYDFDPFDEMNYLTAYVMSNLKPMTSPLWRAESRINGIIGLQPGKHVKWDIPLTTSLNSSKVLNTLTTHDGIKYIYKFNNVKAAHIARCCNDYTTKIIKYPLDDANDKNPLNATRIVGSITVESEYILDMFTEFVVKSITPTTMNDISCTLIELEPYKPT